MTRKVRWAIVGAGQIARSWVAKAIKADPRSELTTVMSRDAARAKKFAEEFAIRGIATSLQEMFDNDLVDAVYVSTGNDRHAEVTLAAARAGRHVLCEKPLSLELAEAVGMARACDAAGVVMGTNHHMRMAATHRAIRDLVQSGRIGRVLAARAIYCEYLPVELQTWRTRDPVSGGVIYDLTVHNIDALRFVLGLDPLEAMSMKAASLIGKNGVEDQTQSVVRFEGDVLCYLHEGSVFAHHETALEVHGSEGSIYGRGVMDEAPSGQVFLRRGKEMTEIPVIPVNLYEGTINRFNAAVLGGGSPSASGWDGVCSLAGALAIRRSAETGTKIAIPPLAALQGRA